MWLDKFTVNDISELLGEERNFVKNVINDFRSKKVIIPNQRGKQQVIKPRHLRNLKSFIVENIGKVVILNDMKIHLEHHFHMMKILKSVYHL